MFILFCDLVLIFYYCEINFVYCILVIVLVVFVISGLNVLLYFDGKNGFKFIFDENIM